MKAFILANGDLPSPGAVRALARRADLIVCADGGARHAIRLRIRPSVILGDLDSLPRAVRATLRGVPVLFDSDQESTDLEKAVRFCIDAGIRTIDVAGALGSRTDHATSALGLFRKFDRRIAITLHDPHGAITRLPLRARFAARPGEQISLIPLRRCTGVVTTNLLYPLRGESLELGVREGVSNTATGRHVGVRYTGGILLLYRFVDRNGRSGRRR